MPLRRYGKQLSKNKWKWLVCLGSFVIQFVVGGLVNSGGVLMSALVDKFNSRRGATAWVTSLASSSLFFFAPISTSLCQRYGCRAAIAIGSVLCVIGLVASSFANNLTVLYFTYGVIWSCGACLIYFPAFIAVSWYFKKSQHAFANGLATSGSALGTMTFSPVNERLFTKLGVNHAFLVLLSFHVVLVFPMIAFRPTRVETEATTPSTEKRRRMFDWSILKNYGYLTLVTALSVFMLVYMVPYVHLVRLAEDLGANKTEAAFLISYVAIASFTGRLVFGGMSDIPCCYRLGIYQVALLSIGVSTTLLSIAPSYPWLVLYAAVFGLFEGCYISLTAVITSDVVGKDKLPSAFGVLYFVISFPKAMGPPIAGWMYDASRSYSTAFLVMGGLTILPVLILFLIPLFKRTTQPRECTQGAQHSEELIERQDKRSQEQDPSREVVQSMT